MSDNIKLTAVEFAASTPADPRVSVSRSKLIQLRGSLIHRLYPHHLSMASGEPVNERFYNFLGPGMEKVSDTALVDAALETMMEHLQNHETDTPWVDPTGIARFDAAGSEGTVKDPNISPSPTTT